MSTGDILLVAATVLLAIGFAALVIVLLRVLDTLRSTREELDALRRQTEPVLAELRDAAGEMTEAMETARADLKRFDRVLGSAEAVGEAVTRVNHSSRVARSAFSVPVIKAAGLATGTSRAVRRLRRRPVELPRRSAS